MTPSVIPCGTCKTMALYGTLIVPSTHRLTSADGHEYHLCTAHAEQLAEVGSWTWEKL